MPLETLLAMALALGLGGLVKGATGMGLPLIAIPILAAFFGVQHAVALMCLPVIMTNSWQVWRFRESLRGSDFLPGMVVGGLVGIAAGTLFIVAAPERALSFALALIIVAYIALRLLNPSFVMSRALGRRLAPGFGFGAGALQGATGIGSPFSVTFVHSMRLAREHHIFAVSVTFLLYTVAQTLALIVADVMTWQIALEGVVAIVPALAAMPLGNWIGTRIGPVGFDRVVLGLLAAVSLKLLWTAFA